MPLGAPVRRLEYPMTEENRLYRCWAAFIFGLISIYLFWALIPAVGTILIARKEYKAHPKETWPTTLGMIFASISIIGFIIIVIRIIPV